MIWVELPATNKGITSLIKTSYITNKGISFHK